jgi:hypothetical protein
VKLTDTSSDWDLLLAWMRGVGEPSDWAAPEGPAPDPDEVPAQPAGQVPAFGRWHASEQRPGRSGRMDARRGGPT